MRQLLIRDVDDETIAALRMRAELHGVSLEQEVRDIIRAAAPAPATHEERLAMVRRLHEGLEPVEFDVPAAIRWGRDDEFTSDIAPSER